MNHLDNLRFHLPPRQFLRLYTQHTPPLAYQGIQSRSGEGFAVLGRDRRRVAVELIAEGSSDKETSSHSKIEVIFTIEQSYCRSFHSLP